MTLTLLSEYVSLPPSSRMPISHDSLPLSISLALLDVQFVAARRLLLAQCGGGPASHGCAREG